MGMGIGMGIGMGMGMDFLCFKAEFQRYQADGRVII